MTHFVATCINGVESLVRSELERQKSTSRMDRIAWWDLMEIWWRHTSQSLAPNSQSCLYRSRKIEVMSLEMIFAVIEQINYTMDTCWYANHRVCDFLEVCRDTYAEYAINRQESHHTFAYGEDDYWKENEHSHPIEIFLLLVADTLHVLINTSGDALHKRGYRTEAGRHPSRNRSQHRWYCLVVGNSKHHSMILCVEVVRSSSEAAMIARNIAPGLKRNLIICIFRGMTSMSWSSDKRGKTKIFEKSYEIYGKRYWFTSARIYYG